MEHSELVQEMPRVEQMSTQDRLGLARKRRVQQLKAWTQREREWLRHRPSIGQRKNNKKNLHFKDNVVLLEAAARNDISEVRKLLNRSVDPNSTNDDGLTALHQCCIDDNVEMLELLLDYGADVNAEDSEKWTPLHAAATCGHLRLVRVLVNRGARLLAVNADGNMPYDICEDEATLDYIESEMAKRGVTQQLIDETRAYTEQIMLQDLKTVAVSGGDLEQHDHQGATPLHIASANGYISVAEFLLDQHVSTDVRDNDDWQPAHAAACWGHLEVLELLVQNGADLNAKNKNDETPADICEDPEIRERIIQLRFEQETRRKEEAARGISRGSRTVRRTQSNTRTQSVRRTSIRDKTLTTKKDAVEEARLRKQAQEDYNPDTIPNNYRNGAELTNGSTLPQTVPIKKSNVQNGDLNENLQLVKVGDRREPDGKDNESFINDDTNISDLPTETNYVTDNNGESPNDMIVTVTVTINAGTLAELKKQRAQIRNSSPELTSLPASPVTQNSNTELPILNDVTSISSVHKFSGNTSDVVGDVTSKRCCIIQ